MTRQWVTAVALVALVALAGCPSLTGTTPSETGQPAENRSPAGTAAPSPPGDTTTGTAVRPTATATVSGPTTTPGAANGSRVRRLLAAHSSALGDDDYELTRSERRRVTGPNGTRADVRRVVARSSAVEDRISGRLTANGTSGPDVTRTNTFVANGTVYRRTVDSGHEPEYAREPAERSHRELHEEMATTGLESLLEAGRYENVSTVERDGRRLARYELAAFDGSPWIRESTVENASGFYLVDREGVVREARLSYRLSDPDAGSTMTVELSYAVETADRLAVERPDWVDEAVEAADGESPAPTSSNRTASAGDPS
ncbi:DUF7537 family lipoprotein [Halosimplex pelagicum]|uniref:Uncharacterized protein n=1 Tax=Halosimplex pelagicum TaxID=869886 RepID=A0A7D5TC12_9EURY|nr:hypothetical protein [Halosimplex pelagicum]QLH82549.1 hypothetical protein HZS54_13395 [Halosimplex pelagicum]